MPRNRCNPKLQRGGDGVGVPAAGLLHVELHHVPPAADARAQGRPAGLRQEAGAPEQEQAAAQAREGGSDPYFHIYIPENLRNKVILENLQVRDLPEADQETTRILRSAKKTN